MSNFGIRQLKNLRFYFCDQGGSSAGIRKMLASQDFAHFVNQNEHVDFEIYMRRGRHPYVSSTYINGYVRDLPLENKSHEEAINHLNQVNNDWGRKALKHSQNRILGGSRSI